MLADDDNPRRQPSIVLRCSGIPSVVWFEDALGAYGVPTMVFELYVLVPDVESAVHVLEQNGWKRIPQQHGRIGSAVLDLDLHPQARLAPPNEDSTRDQSASHSQALTLPVRKLPTTVLLPAIEWNFNLEKNTHPTAFLPSLEDLLDALLDSMLDCSDLPLRRHLNMQIASLYGYVPELQERAFAEGLLYEHRQYHFDIMSGMNFGTVPFVAHEREIRNALRDRSRELQDCSATRDNEKLFSNAVQARLLACLPPVHDEDAEGEEEAG